MAGLLFVALLLVTQRDYGMCWDEGYYYPAYEDARQWTGLLLSHPGDALSSEGIRDGWSEIHELPPVTKWIGAAGSLMVRGVPPQWKLFALRLPGAFLFGATVALIAWIVARRRSLRAGLLTAFAYGLHPRLFGHGHFAASETPMVFLIVAFVAVALESKRARWRVPALAVLAGLALATKVNALIFLTGVALWYAMRAWVAPKRAERTAVWKRDVLEGLVVLCIAPAVALLVWPWMWDDTFARLAEYGRFVRDHSHQGVWYLGKRWNFPEGAPRVPWHYPLAMTLVASPLAWLGFAVAGVAGLARTTRLRIGSAELLLALLVAGPFAAQILPSTPKYDGLRLFLPAFAPATILAGLHAGRGLPAIARRWVPLAGAALLVVEFASGTGRGLGFYNLPARWLAASGPHEFAFEVTYWNEGVTAEVLGDLAELFPEGPVSIRPLAMHGAVLEIQKEWGTIPERFEFGAEPPYDAHLLQNRHGFWGRSEWWYAAEREPLAWWPAGADPAGSSPPLVYLFDGLPPGALPDSQPLTSAPAPRSVGEP